MIKFFADKITYFLIDNKYIDSEDCEVCSYGMEVLLSSLINSLIVLSLGGVFNKFIQTVIFIIGYCSIRQFAGGYHSNCHGKCILTFLLMYLITVIIANKINYMHFKYLIEAIDLLNWISIFLVVPIEHINNPLNNHSRTKNKKRARVRVTLVVVFISIGIILNLKDEYILYSSLALFWVNFMLILQIGENNRENMRNEEKFREKNEICRGISN